MITKITTHVQQAIERLLFQYKDNVEVNNLVESFVTGLQEFENAAFDLVDNTTLANAFGVTLDRIGDIVGLAREAGQSDGEYRVLIRNKIVQNFNEGTAEQFISAALFFLGSETLWFLEVYPAEVDIFSNTVIAPEERERIRSILQSFTPAGVSLGAFGQYDADNPFLFNQPNGLGDTDDPTIGGLLADLY